MTIHGVVKTWPFTFNDLVNAMTNHENHLWARAKWPGLQRKEIEKLLPYAEAAYRRITNTYLVLGAA